MSSSRLAYDRGTYDASVQRSTDPLYYRLAPYSTSNCNRCIPDPSRGPLAVHRTSEPQVLVENELTNRDWKNDRKQVFGGHEDRFHDLVSKYGDDFSMGECEGDCPTYSLLSAPRIQSKSLSTDHLIFSSLPTHPQEVVPLLRSPGGLSSRDVAINEYKKTVKDILKTPR